MPIDLTVIIPTNKERENLSVLIPSLKEIIGKLGISHEIVLVDNDSKDGTEELAKEQNVNFILQENRGYGEALKTGFKIANGSYIITLDADLSHTTSFIYKLWENRHRADMLIASRYVKSGKAVMPFSRKVLSIILNLVYRKFLDLDIRDSSSGFRMYKAEILREISIDSSDFDILQEILIKVYNSGWRILEAPFVYLPRRFGKSKAKLFKFGVAYAKNIFKLWLLRHSINAADYDSRAFDSIIPLQRYWQRKRFMIISNFIEHNTEVLDIGCGSSRFIASMPQAVGLDKRINVLRFNKKTHKKLVQASLEKMPFKDNCFNIVVCSEVIEHIPVGKVDFKELNRMLKDNGILIIGTPDYEKLEWRVIEFLYKNIYPLGYADEHINRYTFNSLMSNLKESGFRVEGYKYILNSELIIKARKVARL